MTELDHLSSRTSRRFVWTCFLLALLLDLIPLPAKEFFWLPEVTALMLLYWLLHRPDMVNLGTAFMVGLLLDIGSSSPLGQHALAYTVSGYFVLQQQRQASQYDSGLQALIVLAALLCNQIVMIVVRLFHDQLFIGWLYLVPPFLGALLWPLFNKVMVQVLNFRRQRR